MIDEIIYPNIQLKQCLHSFLGNDCSNCKIDNLVICQDIQL
uniref:Uncharacterized protein n=1 Tax=Onchocerca volvulus TaxID=6282 RepID=A0A2K6VVN6_ONCVO